MLLTDTQTAALCRTLAVLLHAGIPVTEGLYLICQEETGSIKTVAEALLAQMDQGIPLWEAMQTQKFFPAPVPSMIRVGEETGRLEEALTGLADWNDQRVRTRQLIRSALMYPTAILVMMLMVILVLLVQVLPVFDRVYASLGTHLGGLAGWMLHLGQLLKASLPMLGTLLLAAGILLLLYRFRSSFRLRVRDFFLRRFGDRSIARSFNNARFSRALAMGVSSGLPLEEALKLSCGLLSHIPAAHQRCQTALDQLEQGQTLALALGGCGLLSSTHLHLLQAGLRSGSADRILYHIAEQAETQAQERLETLVSRVEPAIVTVCALLVGTILLSVMLPLMNVLAALG